MSKDFNPQTFYIDPKTKNIIELLNISYDNPGEVISKIDGKKYYRTKAGNLINPTKLRGKAAVKQMKKERNRMRKAFKNEQDTM